jgi:WD40 repeat protein
LRFPDQFDGALSHSKSSILTILTPVTGSHWRRCCAAARALCVLPDDRLASGSDDGTIRLWDVTTGAESARLLTALADLHLVAGDILGRLHWLEVVVRSGSRHEKGRYHA